METEEGAIDSEPDHPVASAAPSNPTSLKSEDETGIQSDPTPDSPVESASSNLTASMETDSESKDTNDNPDVK